MKKYLLLVCALTLLSGGIYYLIYFDGSLYLPKGQEGRAVQTNFQIKGRQIQASSQGKEPFTVKGVDIESSLAGHHNNEFAIGKKKYLDWLQKIAAMGANTIRVKTIMDVDFYEALAEHNKKAPSPLYLLQGIRINDYRNNSAISGTDKKFQGQLVQDAKTVVDVIHGRKRMWNHESGASNHYRKDVSKWVLAFIVGDDWNSGTVAYTNHQEQAQPFKGKYFVSKSSANSFEVMLAQVMEELVQYETDKYGWQHLLSFANSAFNDPFDYRKPFADQAPKYSRLDIEQIKSQKTFKTGLFASYQLLDIHPKFKDYLLLNKAGVNSKLLSAIKKLPTLQAYVKLLTSYHQVPVMVTGYGYSTARGIEQTKINDLHFPLSETDQGKYLVKDYKAFLAAGTVGATIHSWQDDWNSRSWNTSFATNPHENFLWHDLQVSNSAYGLLAFENTSKKHILNGKKDQKEWEESKDKLGQTSKKEGQLMVDYDETYLYFAIERKSKTDNKWLIPIDVTPKSGSKKMENSKLRFEKAADFVLKIDTKGQSQILVQERYNATEANYSMQTRGVDSFIRPPAKDSPVFNPIEMVLKNNQIFENIEKASRESKWLPKYETGKLRLGNGERGASNFDSRSDLAVSDHLIEGRIPLHLLNFSNPADAKVHDDYYEKYGVEDLTIQALSLGISKPDKEEVVQMADFPLSKWEKPQVDDVLKASYKLLQEAWTRKENK
ncbi:hypothetical protein [Streptococcus oricebi]|uniref:Uncharacterized protein n=1 Tax=Streptococcus oricebi TaxID=1547447 RepID=A0ABS5B1G1_9STRE|nr:hypothetical protein [Streptococcus oricebi]MBP2622323.1 hypothetical protein [Streptococcus oricebi]